MAQVGFFGSYKGGFVALKESFKRALKSWCHQNVVNIGPRTDQPRPTRAVILIHSWRGGKNEICVDLLYATKMKCPPIAQSRTSVTLWKKSVFPALFSTRDRNALILFIFFSVESIWLTWVKIFFQIIWLKNISLTLKRRAVRALSRNSS